MDSSDLQPSYPPYSYYHNLGITTYLLTYYSSIIVQWCGIVCFYRLSGADNGVASLFFGFFIEMVSVVGATACFACYKVWIPLYILSVCVWCVCVCVCVCVRVCGASLQRCRSERRGHASVLSGGSQEQEMLTVELEQTDDRGDTVENNALSTEDIRTSEVVQRTPQENVEQTSVL